jgi:uncharacterized protein (TIGR02118 family)
MASFHVLYSKPEDVEGFEAHYRDTHMPMVDRTPGVTGTRVARGTGTPRGGDPAYHLIAEITFGSDEDLQAALRSEEFRAVGKDAMEMTQRFGVQATMIIAEDF